LLLFAKKKGNRREQREQSTFVITGYNNEAQRSKGTVIGGAKNYRVATQQGNCYQSYLLPVDN